QMMGTLTMRPSVRNTCIISSSNLTACASAVLGTYPRRPLCLADGCDLTEVLIPRLQQFYLMFTNDALDLVEIVCFETVVARQFDGLKPEFGLIGPGFHMDVRRLFVFVAEEIEPITSNSQHSGHPLRIIA